MALNSCGAGCQPGRLLDLADRHTGVPVLGEQLQRDLHHPLSPISTRHNAILTDHYDVVENHRDEGRAMANLRTRLGSDRDALVVTCRDDRVQEVRLCLDRALAPRTCGADVLRSACRDRGPLDLPPIR